MLSTSSFIIAFWSQNVACTISDYKIFIFSILPFGIIWLIFMNVSLIKCFKRKHIKSCYLVIDDIDNIKIECFLNALQVMYYFRTFIFQHNCFVSLSWYLPKVLWYFSNSFSHSKSYFSLYSIMLFYLEIKASLNLILVF